MRNPHGKESGQHWRGGCDPTSVTTHDHTIAIVMAVTLVWFDDNSDDQDNVNAYHHRQGQGQIFPMS